MTAAGSGDPAEARRAFGAEVRRLRRAAGLTQAALGDRVGYSRVYITLVETGRDAPGEDCVRRLGHALNAGDDLLALYREVRAPRRQHATPVIGGAAMLQANDTVAVPAQAPDGGTVLVNVTRRALLRGIGAMALGSTLAPAAAVNGMTSLPSSDVAPIEHFRQMQRVLIDSDNLFGPARVIPSVYEQIGVLQQLRSTVRGADGRALLGLQAQFAEFSAWLHQDQGDHETAWYWTDRALEWSHLAGDPAVTTFILARKSQLAGDMRDAYTAVDFAEAAGALAPGGTRLAAVASTYAAHGHALAGDATASARAYDRARVLLDSGDVDPAVSWGVWLDHSYIAAQLARAGGARCGGGRFRGRDRRPAAGLPARPGCLPGTSCARPCERGAAGALGCSGPARARSCAHRAVGPDQRRVAPAARRGPQRRRTGGAGLPRCRSHRWPGRRMIGP